MPRDFAEVAWDAALEDDCRQLIRLAVREDLDRSLDWTTMALVPPDTPGVAAVVARRGGVVAGLPAARLVLDEMDPRMAWEPAIEEGARVQPGTKLAVIRGPAQSLLTAERPLLNFLGRLCGVATLTRRYVDAIAGTNARVYDTRKTTPGWRRLEKYAVRMGGGRNHRTGLFDAILIKDNHLALGVQGERPGAASSKPYSPAEAVGIARRFLASLPATAPQAAMLVEVEVDTLAQFADVLSGGAIGLSSGAAGGSSDAAGVSSDVDIVLLDNMSLAELRAAVAERDAKRPTLQLEASGGVTLESIRAIAETGVDRISVGALTHSAEWFDVGLDWGGLDREVGG